MAAFLQTAVAEADAQRFETVLSWWTQAQPMQVCAHHYTWHDDTTPTLPRHPRVIGAPARQAARRRGAGTPGSWVPGC